MSCSVERDIIAMARSPSCDNVISIIRHANQSIDWMSIFNSDMELSNEFIVTFINYIKWDLLTRPLPEVIIERYKKNIVQWNAQMYGPLRTIEFLIEYKNKIDWIEISKCPPQWFNEYHSELFADLLDWYELTPYAINYSLNLLYLFADYLNWDWISSNNIRDESFAKRFINRIKWDCHNLDTSNLSTEFLYDVQCSRMLEYNISNGIIDEPCIAKYSALTNKSILEGFDPNNKNIRLGATITLRFFRKYIDLININELKNRGMFTQDMQTVIDNSY